MNATPGNTVSAPEFDRDMTLRQFHSAEWKAAPNNNREAWFPVSVATSMKMMLSARGEFRAQGITQDPVVAPIARGSRLKRGAQRCNEDLTQVLMSERDYQGLKAYCETHDVKELSQHEVAAEDCRDRFK